MFSGILLLLDILVLCIIIILNLWFIKIVHCFEMLYVLFVFCINCFKFIVNWFFYFFDLVAIGIDFDLVYSIRLSLYFMVCNDVDTLVVVKYTYILSLDNILSCKIMVEEDFDYFNDFEYICCFHDTLSIDYDINHFKLHDLFMEYYYCMQEVVSESFDYKDLIEIILSHSIGNNILEVTEFEFFWINHATSFVAFNDNEYDVCFRSICFEYCRTFGNIYPMWNVIGFKFDIDGQYDIIEYTEHIKGCDWKDFRTFKLFHLGSILKL